MNEVEQTVIEPTLHEHVQEQDAPEEQSSSVDRSNLFVNGYLLLTSAVIIGLSFVMNSEGETTVFLPGTSMPLPEICSARRTFGIDCPGCGLTRSFINLAHGQLERAFHFHPLGFFLFLLIAFQIPFRSIQTWRIWHGKRPLKLPRWEYAWYCLLIAMILVWVVRMATRFLA